MVRAIMKTDLGSLGKTRVVISSETKSGRGCCCSCSIRLLIALLWRGELHFFFFDLLLPRSFIREMSSSSPSGRPTRTTSSAAEAVAQAMALEAMAGLQMMGAR